MPNKPYQASITKHSTFRVACAGQPWLAFHQMQRPVNARQALPEAACMV